MLVKFHSSTSGEILMFADAARQGIECLGKEPLAKGVVTFEQLPDAIARIAAAIGRAKEQAPEPDETGDDRPQVGLAQRFVPLLELFRRTLDDEGYVMWEAPQDFGRPG